MHLAIETPYAHCNLTNYSRDSEDRPPFVNYGGQYGDRQFGEKRTFNSLAVHVCFFVQCGLYCTEIWNLF